MLQTVKVMDVKIKLIMIFLADKGALFKRIFANSPRDKNGPEVILVLLIIRSNLFHY